MSTIVTDTLQGKTSATSITLPTTTNIGSTPLVSASANSMTIRGEGSAVTNIQQGLCKAWVHLTQVSTQTIRDSFNVASITDFGTGKTRPTFSNNMGNDDYAATMYSNGAANTGSGDWNYYKGGLTARTTSTVDQISYNSSGPALIDSGLVDINIHGDLA